MGRRMYKSNCCSRGTEPLRACVVAVCMARSAEIARQAPSRPSALVGGHTEGTTYSDKRACL